MTLSQIHAKLNMSSLVEKLTAEGDGESAGQYRRHTQLLVPILTASTVFLNEIVAQLWPNINVAGSAMIKEIAEPMFKTMLPGPLKTLHFTKIDLGTVPLRLTNVLATRTDTDGIKLDMNVDWEGKCDIELDADMIPSLGVEHVKLRGRLSILLAPLTNIIPLIGAAQIAFINPPILELDFTGAANVADFSLIDSSVRGVILSIINGMATLPNRFLVTLDAKNDYFKTHLYPLGVLRVTVVKAAGFAEEAKGKAKAFFSKLTRASPDSYAKVAVGAEEPWSTTVKNNTTHPAWNETHDFVVTDFDQCLTLDLMDSDVGGDDEIGLAVTTVKEILLAGGTQDLGLTKKREQTPGTLSVACEFFKFEKDGGSFSEAAHQEKGRLSGLATILVASAFGIKGQREELQPSVIVTCGPEHKFQTVVKVDAPGTDISNPTFDQNFRVPITADLVGSSFRIALMNKEKEVGAVEIPYADVLKVPDMILQNKFDVGGGATVRASICLRGIKAASMQETRLPQRQKQ